MDYSNPLAKHLDDALVRSHDIKEIDIAMNAQMRLKATEQIIEVLKKAKADGKLRSY